MAEINILLVAFLAVFFFFDMEPPSAAAKSRSSSNTGACAPKNIERCMMKELLSVLANSLKALLIDLLIKMRNGGSYLYWAFVSLCSSFLCLNLQSRERVNFNHTIK